MSENEKINPSEFFGWKTNPFIDLHLHREPFLTKREQTTLKMAIQLLSQGKSFAITGPAGVGKSTLLHQIISKLDRRSYRGIFVPYPGFRRSGLPRAIAEALNLDLSKKPIPPLIKIQRHLLQLADQPEPLFPILIVDDAQLIDIESLLDICTILTNPNNKTPAASLILSGNEELTKTLMLTRMASISTRLACTFNLEPLSDKETMEFLLARIKAAQAPLDLIEKEAIHLINAKCRGNKRDIMNLGSILCMEAMFRNEKTISAQLAIQSEICQISG